MQNLEFCVTLHMKVAFFVKTKQRKPKSTDPAREAMKAARRNLDHDEAVQEVWFLQQQYRRQWSDRMAASPFDLYVLLRTLTQKRIPFVLIGAHGFAAWTGRPRNTQVVDILVNGGRNLSRAVKAIRELYPQLEERSFPGLIAFFVPGEKDSVVDMIYPHRAHLAEALEDPVWTENKEEGLRCRIAALEAALSSKYGAMLNPTRDRLKRMQDIIDFSWMVRHSQDEGRQPIDLHRLEMLGEKVWPGGGGKEILRMVESERAGKAISLDSLGTQK
jgi:hypothetical protein